jgi:hypothetical protein
MTYAKKPAPRKKRTVVFVALEVIMKETVKPITAVFLKTT